MAEEIKKKSRKELKREKKANKKKRKSRKVFRYIFLAVLVLFIVGAFTIGGQVLKLRSEAKDLVSNASEKTFKATQTSLVYDTNGDKMITLKGEKDVYYLKYDELPVYAVASVISVEDQDFYQHNGISIRGIARAVVSLIKNKGTVTQGGSTITQQLARGVFLTNEQTWKRKVKEIFIAIELEKSYSKDQIMEFYLNNIYFANGYYGIQAAAQGYFGKDASELTMSETAFLCSVPNAPTMYDPYRNKDKTMVRRDKILKDMYEQELITKSQYQEALDEEITVKKKKSETKRNYVETYTIYCAVRALMKEEGFTFKTKFASDSAKEEYEEEYNKLYAKCKTQLYSSGYRIYTSIDLTVQKQLQKSVNDSLTYYTEKDKNGIYKAQAAGTCIDNDTGKVVAIVGGREQKSVGYTLNRAYQSPRQPGSSIKPLVVFAPAMEAGYGPGSMVNDSPMKSTDKHRVNNSGGSYSGTISLRRAVAKSSNVVSMRLYEELGPDTALGYLEDMKFKYLTEEDYKYYTTCIGGFTKGTTTEEMAAGYATLANDGVYREPTCIVKIEDAEGNTIVSNPSTKKTVFSETTASMMTSVLQTVVESGTGKGSKVPNVDTAGKTGTTTSNRDGWFCGYTPYYTTAVWVGRDDNKVMSALSGASYPMSIWSNFMNQIHSQYASGSSSLSGSDYASEGNGRAATTASTGTGTTSSATTQSTQAATTAPSTQAATTAETTQAATTAAGEED